MTYAELLQQVKDYLQTDETTFNNNIPTFVKLAEEDIYRKVDRLPALRKTSLSNLTADSQYLTLPTDFLAVDELAIIVGGVHTYLIKKDVSFIRECFTAAATTGTPKYYGLSDADTVVVGPTPSTSFSIELRYNFQPESIVTASTSWLGDNAANALLWGTVLQGYAFLKGDPDLIAVYKAAYDTAIEALNKLQSLTAIDSYRHGAQ